MGAQEGRPYCLKAMSYILKEGESTSKLTKQCRNCGQIIYVGCKGFVGGHRIGESEVYNWIRWWYHSIPYPISPEPDVQSLTSKARIQE